jgi:proteasome accessory factor C
VSPRPLAGSRLRRMLALVPWITAHPGTTITELAQRFQVDEREIEADLELLPMCGLPPYTADRLIDVWVADDGAVNIRLAEYFGRPLRLTPMEGVALLAAGRALLAVPGSDDRGPLARALDKLEHGLGARGGIAVDVADADHLERLQEAVAAHERLELEYYSFARDEMTTRVVEPARVFHAFGAWYLAAYCHRAEADRLFRVDRVRAVHPTGEFFDRPTGMADDELGDLVYRPAPDDLRVRLRLEPEAGWVADSLPVEAVTRRGGGRLEVTLAVSGVAFLERLLLQLGPRGKVLSPPHAQRSRREAARRVLQRYESDA